MKHYIETLKALADRTTPPVEPATRPISGDCRIRCEIPIIDQIEALMRSLPPAQRNRPWAMADLVGRLHGRYQVRPSAGDVGIALRRLGWTQTRDWTQEGEGRRMWIRHSR